MLSVMANSWNLVFGKKLGKAERNIVTELRLVRNDWAHQEPFSKDDAYRALDSAERLLRAIGAASEVEVLRSTRLQVLEEIRCARTDNGAAARLVSQVAVAQRGITTDSRRRAESKSVTGKYRPLHAHLTRVRDDDVTITFEEIERILGDGLPPSAYKHRAWWANEDPHKTIMRGKRSWLLAGFKAYPDMNSRRVTFRRASSTTGGKRR